MDAQIKLVELVRFFMEVNIHQHATYFVDSLWDNSDVLRVRLLAPYHLYSLLNALSLLSLSPLSNPLSFSLCLTLSPLPFSPSYHIQNFSSFAFDFLHVSRIQYLEHYGMCSACHIYNKFLHSDGT